MKEKDYMEAKKWAGEATKLKKKYKSYDELRKHCTKIFNKLYFGLSEIPEKNIIVVKSNNTVEGGKAGHLHAGNIPFYNVKEDGSLEKIDVEDTINDLVKELAHHIDRESLIRDVLQNESPLKLQEIYERVIDTPKKTKKKPSIKQKLGCQYLSIGGKRGKTETLYLR